jgi:hypothetical protein
LSRVAARAACETRSNAAAIASTGSRLCEPAFDGAFDGAGEEPEPPQERPLFERSSELRVSRFFSLAKLASSPAAVLLKGT